ANTLKMASWVQSVPGATGTQPPPVTINGLTAGNGLAALITWRTATGTVSIICDSAGGTNANGAWVQVSGALGQGNVLSSDIWYRLNAPAGSLTVTVTLSAAQTSAALTLEEWNGLGASEGGAHGTGSTGTNPTTTPALVTTGSADILIACGRGQTFSTPPAPWTADPNNIGI